LAGQVNIPGSNKFYFRSIPVLLLVLFFDFTATAQDDLKAIFTAPEQVCGSETVTFRNMSTGGISHTWFIDGSQVQSNPGPDDLVRSFTNNGSVPIYFEIRLLVRDNEDNEDDFIKNITVFPEITAAFSILPESEGCHPLTVSFNNESEGNTGTWEWNFGDGASSWHYEPTHTYLNYFSPDDEIFTVSLVATSPFFCRDTATAEITVTPYLEALFVIDTVRGCHELEVTLTDLSTIWADEYSWDMGDGSVYFRGPGEIINHTYINDSEDTRVYTIRLTLSKNGCSDIMEKEVTLFPRVTAAFTAVTDGECSPVGVEFTSSSWGASNYLWEFGDGGTSSEPDHYYTYPKNLTGADIIYYARLIALSDDLCRDTTDYTGITVRPHVEAGFETDITEGCHPLEVTFTNTSTGASGYLWNFGDGSPQSDIADDTFTQTFENLTGEVLTYTVRLTASNDHDCDHFTEREIKVYPLVSAGFTVDPDEGCSPLTVDFTNNSSAHASGFIWDFGDGNTSGFRNPKHTYEKNMGENDTIYGARLIAVSEYLCHDTTGYQDIVIFPHVAAGFTIDISEGCHPVTVTVTDHSHGADNYTWRMGDGTMHDQKGGSFTHTYYNTGNELLHQTITLETVNSRGCNGSSQAVVTIYPELVSGFSADETEGCGPLTVNFTNNSDHASAFLWDFGDGASSIDRDPRHTFHNPGIADTVYLVRLTSFSANGECSEESWMNITVYGSVKAGFTFDGSPACHPFMAEFTNTSLGGDIFTWDFGDGSVAVVAGSENPPPHEYRNSSFNDTAEFTITLTVESSLGCSDSIAKTLKVYPDITAEITGPSEPGCHPFIADFSSAGSRGAFYYHWDFGDGNTSSLADPRHLFSNLGAEDSIYTVTLIVTAENSTCSDTQSIDITVHPYVNASFGFTGSPACTPFELLLENYSLNAVEYYWDLGDGNDTVTYNSEPFSHTFVNSSFSTILHREIELRAMSREGCESTEVKTVTIYPGIEALFEAGRTSGCHPLTVNFASLSEGEAHYLWDFGDGNSSSQAEPQHVFTNTGTEDSVYTSSLLS
jgi:PKD repeat protein